jgi:hypothetical protein
MKQPVAEHCVPNTIDICLTLLFNYMCTLRQLYHRLDTRVRALSRVSYAILIGLVSALGVFAVRSLLAGDGSFGPVAMGVSMAVVYYVFDPNNEN